MRACSLEGHLATGRLGKLLQCDAYVKWYRSAEYYSRPIKGSWADRRRRRADQPGDPPGRSFCAGWPAGPELFGDLAAGRRAQDRIRRRRVNAVMRYANGATGVHSGVHGLLARLSGAHRDSTARRARPIISGDKLTTWDVRETRARRRRSRPRVASGASRSDGDFARAVRAAISRFRRGDRDGRPPVVSGEEGYEALELVDAIYRSCRTDAVVTFGAPMRPMCPDAHDEPNGPVGTR